MTDEPDLRKRVMVMVIAGGLTILACSAALAALVIALVAQAA
ncbi:hypothetical protein [Streptomyces sp. NPDC091212]